MSRTEDTEDTELRPYFALTSYEGQGRGDGDASFLLKAEKSGRRCSGRKKKVKSLKMTRSGKQLQDYALSLYHLIPYP